jgi:hypothetical protein
METSDGRPALGANGCLLGRGPERETTAPQPWPRGIFENIIALGTIPETSGLPNRPRDVLKTKKSHAR